MSNYFTYSLIVGGVIFIIVLMCLRPRKTTIVQQPNNTQATTNNEILDLNGIALVEVLQRLDETISKLIAIPIVGANGVTNPERERWEATVVVMVRSALYAHIASLEWRRTRGLSPDLKVNRSLGENFCDAWKQFTVGTPRWQELKLELDKFSSRLAALTIVPVVNNITTDDSS